jgi:curved DNA-binding protein CbpA
MTDYFQLLGQPRRPWLDEALLKQRFLELSSQWHPDRVHNAPEAERRAADQRYAELNAAYQCLREPRDRLRHFLELETGAKPAEIQQAPPELMDQFFEIGRLCREADQLIAEQEKTTSPMLRAKVFGRAMELSGSLTAIQHELQTRTVGLLAELKALDADWQPGAPPPARLEEIRRLLGYCARWSGQLQERSVRLTL